MAAPWDRPVSSPRTSQQRDPRPVHQPLVVMLALLPCAHAGHTKLVRDFVRCGLTASPAPALVTDRKAVLGQASQMTTNGLLVEAEPVGDLPRTAGRSGVEGLPDSPGIAAECAPPPYVLVGASGGGVRNRTVPLKHGCRSARFSRTRVRWVLIPRRRPMRMRVIMPAIIDQARRPFNADETDGVSRRHR